jgi:hypothetical protein
MSAIAPLARHGPVLRVALVAAAAERLQFGRLAHAHICDLPVSEFDLHPRWRQRCCWRDERHHAIRSSAGRP